MATADGTWQCKKCTLINSPNVLKCDVCEYNKTGTAPAVENLKVLKSNKLDNSSKIEINSNVRNKINSSNVFEIIANQISKAYESIVTNNFFSFNSSDYSQNQSNSTFLNTSFSKCSICNTRHNFKNSLFCYSCAVSQTMLRKDTKLKSDNFINNSKSHSLREENTSNFTKQVEQIILHCQKTNTKFIDDSFLPMDRSIFNNNSSKLLDQLNDRHLNIPNGSIQWLRPSSLGKYKLIDCPKSTDIEQGLLGNCWFLSAIAVLAEKPFLLENIFANKTISNEGVYQMRFCSQGEWIDVFIDDLLPCDCHGRLIFTKVKQDQLWVPLLEKALAKVYGCYESLKAGRCIEGFSLLTGAPCESVSFDDLGLSRNEEKYNFLWAKLLSSSESGFLMGASCGINNKYQKNNEPNFNFENVGLVNRHSYSILDIKDFHGLRMIKLRNPWGAMSWKQGCADYSQQDLKSFGLFKKEEDIRNGVFWMAFADFIKFYNSVDICKFGYDWLDHRILGTFSSDPTSFVSVYDILVSESQEIEVGLFNKVNKRQKSEEYLEIDLFVAVYKFPEKPNVLVGSLVESSTRSLSGFVGFNCFIEPGLYRVLCTSFSLLNSTLSAKYCLTIHYLKSLEYTVTNLPNRIMAESIVELCKSKGEYYQLHAEVYACLLKEDWCGFIATVFNSSKKYSIQLTSDLSGSFNVKSSRKSLITHDIIPPEHAMVVSLLTQMDSKMSVEVKWVTTSRECFPGTKLRQTFPNISTYFHSPEIDENLQFIHRPIMF